MRLSFRHCQSDTTSLLFEESSHCKHGRSIISVEVELLALLLFAIACYYYYYSTEETIQPTAEDVIVYSSAWYYSMNNTPRSSLPRVRRHRASKPQGSSERVLPWQPQKT